MLSRPSACHLQVICPRVLRRCKGMQNIHQDISAPSAFAREVAHKGSLAVKIPLAARPPRRPIRCVILFSHRAHTGVHRHWERATSPRRRIDRFFQSIVVDVSFPRCTHFGSCDGDLVFGIIERQTVLHNRVVSCQSALVCIDLCTHVHQKITGELSALVPQQISRRRYATPPPMVELPRRRSSATAATRRRPSPGELPSCRGRPGHAR